VSRVLALVGLVAALLGFLAGDAVARPTVVTDAGGREFRAGAPGIGDPYFPEYGNGGYDVSHYHLEIRYTPNSGRLEGHAVLSVTATANLFAFDLDFGDLTVLGVAVDDRAAGWARHGSRELVVTPARRLVSGQRFTVDVRYVGTPGGGSLNGTNVSSGFLRTRDGVVVAGEPEGATEWFPVNDHPRDKATYDLAITVPDGFTAVSNGVLDGTSSADGWTTYRWSEHAPMASYLATMAVGRFRIVTGEHGGLPVYTAVAESLPVDRADPAVARTPEIVDFLASRFGPYPFDAMGAIVPDVSIAFSLETQTRPVYSPGAFQSGSVDDRTSIVAHELAHQWYGDSVSLHDWRDIWLNEGFATYAQWLWDEHIGRRTVAQDFERVYAAPETSPIWRPAPGEPGPGKLFGQSVYQRGAMTLHALRLAVGDGAFFRILRGWAAAHRFGNGSTAQFQALAESVAGRSLNGLFRTWLYSESKPPHP
jgi:aminopeptidase N